MQREQRKPYNKSRVAGLTGFTQFFRSYIKAWPILIACLIGPMSKYFHLIPMYSSHEGLATGIVSVYGFLFAAALFYYRPALIRGRRLTRLLPAILIAFSFGALFGYWILIQNSIRQETDLARRLGVRSDQLAPDQVLSRTSLQSIPNGTPLLACYLASFFAAESGIILLALNEYKKPRRRDTNARPNSNPTN
jgi:hypothetical protein